MKFIISIIVLLYLVNYSLSNYITFEPFNNDQCNPIMGEQVSGIGYSIALDSCITIDHHHSFLFKQSGIQVSWTKYVNPNDQCKFNQDGYIVTKYLGSCIPASQLNFNSNVKPLKPVYYKLLLTNQPYFPPYNVTVSAYSLNECDIQSTHLVEYYIAGTEFQTKGKSNHFDNSYYQYFCLCGNTPHTQKCSHGHCLAPQPSTSFCQEIPPFFNDTSSSSSDTSSQSDSSDSTCISGGYTTFTGCLPDYKDNIKNTDKGGKQNIISKNGIDINYPQSLSYYHSVYCLN
ncbi:hypothetical protein ACTA71_003655 [Dictyostelium dimigraforme]